MRRPTPAQRKRLPTRLHTTHTHHPITSYLRSTLVVVRSESPLAHKKVGDQPSSLLFVTVSHPAGVSASVPRTLGIRLTNPPRETPEIAEVYRVRREGVQLMRPKYPKK